MFNPFVLNSVLHHVGLLWIITSNNKIKYKTEENDPDLLTKGLCYNTTICSKFHGTVFEVFIRNSRTDRYNMMCFITSHDRQKIIYVEMQAVLTVEQYLRMQQHQH